MSRFNRDHHKLAEAFNDLLKFTHLFCRQIRKENRAIISTAQYKDLEASMVACFDLINARANDSDGHIAKPNDPDHHTFATLWHLKKEWVR